MYHDFIHIPANIERERNKPYITVYVYTCIHTYICILWMHLAVKRCFWMFVDQSHVIAPGWRYDREVWPRPLANPKCGPWCFWILRVWELSLHLLQKDLVDAASSWLSHFLRCSLENSRTMPIATPRKSRDVMAEQPSLVTQVQWSAPGS